MKASIGSILFVSVLLILGCGGGTDYIPSDELGVKSEFLEKPDLSSQGKLSIILEELESPVHAGFDIGTIINSLEMVEVAPHLDGFKQKIVQALEMDLSKLK